MFQCFSLRRAGRREARVSLCKLFGVTLASTQPTLRLPPQVPARPKRRTIVVAGIRFRSDRSGRSRLSDRHGRAIMRRSLAALVIPTSGRGLSLTTLRQADFPHDIETWREDANFAGAIMTALRRFLAWSAKFATDRLGSRARIRQAHGTTADRAVAAIGKKTRKARSGRQQSIFLFIHLKSCCLPGSGKPLNLTKFYNIKDRLHHILL